MRKIFFHRIVHETSIVHCNAIITRLVGSKVAYRDVSITVRHKLGPHIPPTSILSKFYVQSDEKKMDTHELLHINKQ